MRGYTAKKGNRYYAVIYEGVDPATGKERRRWYPAGPRKSDADKLVTELVKRHNGRIWFESKEGQGSTFFMALPHAS